MQPYLIRATDRESFKRCRRAWDLGSRSRQSYEPVEADHQPSLDSTLVDALAVYYFPGMWGWDRTIVQPLVHQALERSWKKSDPGGKPPAGAHALLDHYAAWAVTVDHFNPVRAAYDYVANIPDPVLPGRDLATPEGGPVRYVGQIDALVLDEWDRPWILPLPGYAARRRPWPAPGLGVPPPPS